MAFIPKYIRQQVNNSPRSVVTSDRWNELWNLTITQGDYNSETLDALINGPGAESIGANPVGNGTATTVQGVLEELDADVTALDGTAVHKTGNETIDDVKTFSSSPIVPAPTTDMQAATKKYVDDTDGARKTYVDNLDALAVHLAGTETITGVKTFSASPIVPAPVSDTHPATKKYVDDADVLKVNITDIVNDLTTGGTAVPLSAEQGKVLKENSDTHIADTLKHKQAASIVQSGTLANAEGYVTKAYGYTSHAEGNFTIARGEASHAEGYNTEAYGEASHAEGQFSIASGRCAHAQNLGTLAQGLAQTAVGMFNVGQGSGVQNPTDNAFIVGNGMGDLNRSNAMSVTWAGDLTLAGGVTAAGNVNIATGKKYKINDTDLSASDVGAVATTDIVNTLTETGTGKVLDARQGKVLADLVSTNTADISRQISALTEEILNIDGLENADLIVDPDTNFLFLSNNGEPIGWGVKLPEGGSGGGTIVNNAIISLTNTSGWVQKTTAFGFDCNVSFLWSSVERGVATGNGIMRVNVNSIDKYTTEIIQGNISINLKPYLTLGANTVKIYVYDIYGNTRIILLNVSTVSISLESNFVATTPFTGDIHFTYTPTGEAEKTMHFVVDGVLIDTALVTASGREQYYDITALSHGSHSLLVYFTATVENQEVTSNELYFDLMCLETGEADPIIASDFRDTAFSQYDTIVIPYRVYTPSFLESTVELYANEVLLSTISVDRDEQTWSYRATDAGQLTLKIVCGLIEKTFTLTIGALNIDVAAETSGLSLHLESYGRNNGEVNPGTWEYGSTQAVFSGFNWVSDGWQADEDGVTCLRVTGDARVVIPHNIFSGDPRVTGRTIEIDFVTKDVLDYETNIISCHSGNVGIKIKPQRALIESEQSDMETLYKENEHIRLAFVVEKQNDYRLVYCYVNGILSRVVQYPAYDSFTQFVPVGISIGSNLCTTDVYSIRVYNTNLTRHQLLDNWIADTQLVDDLLARYSRNNIFDEYGNIIIAKLPNYLPYLILTGPELPQYKGDKKTLMGSYTDPLYPEKSFTFTGASVDVQGTSSQYYARKNYKINFKAGFVIAGVQTSEYRLRETSIPESVFTFKADVASSEGVNNTELVRIYNDTCPYKTPPQVDDPVVRQGIDGFPIVVFWNNGVDTTFLGKYNFNNDKANLSTFGFTGGDESWEILNNTSDRVLFKSADFTGDAWKNDFESRQPEDYFDTSKLQPYVAWIASTDQSAATDAALAAPVTYGGVEYSTDSAAYRLAKFKAELATYAELDSVLFYYLFTELFLMTDSRAKNAFPTKFNTGKWCFLPYDFDTAMGANNEGSLVFSYELEDIDLFAGATIFNGQNSVLWINLRQAFYDELSEMYQDLRSTGELSYPKVKQIFEDHQAKWSEAIFNEDAFFKYLEPLFDDNTTAYLGMLQGSKAEQRKWFLYNRFRYLDSKYQAGDSINDVITVRGYAKSNITVTPYADIYATIKYGSYTVQERALRGGDYELICPLDNVNDTEIYIYSASQLKSVGDLSGLKVGYAEFSLATRLQSLKLGDSSAGYSNTNLTVLHLGNNVMLQTLDVRNCPNLVQTVDISGCTNIENIYFDGSGITGAVLPNGGVVKVLHLPSTITNLTIRNQANITDFSMPSYANISTLRIENTPNLPLQSIITGATALSRVRLIGIDESFADDSILASLMSLGGLDEQNNNIATPVVTGRCYISEVGDGILSLLNAAFPELVITYGQLLVTHVVTFKNWDDTVLDVQYVVSGGSATDPITRQYNQITTPTKPSTAQYDFAYLAWDSGLTNIFVDKTIKPTWTSILRSYTVKFYNGTTLLQTIPSVNYGSDALYTGGAPEGPEGYLFEEWLPSPLNIQGPTDCIAQFSEIAMPTTFKSLEDLTWGELSALITNGTIETVWGAKSVVTRSTSYPFNETIFDNTTNIYADAETTALSANALAAAFSPDGTKLVLGGDFTGFAKLYSVSESGVTFVSDIYANAGTTALVNYVSAAAFSPDGTKLVLGGRFTGDAKLYSVSESGVTFVGDITALDNTAYAAAFSPDGTKLVVGGQFTGYAKLYSVSESGVTFVSDIYADAGTTALSANARCVAFSPDGTKLVLGGDFTGFAKLYSVSESGVTFVSDIYANAGTTALGYTAYAAAFSPDGTKLVLGGKFIGRAKLYSVSESGVTFVSDIYANAGTTALSANARCVAFSPDGTKLVLGGDFTGYAKLYSVSESGVTFAGNFAPSYYALAAAFSPDGTKLVLGGSFTGYAKLYTPTPITKWFTIGSEKTLLLTTNEALTLQVYDFLHDTITGTSDKAKVTFGLKYTMNTARRMNATDTNVGGWDGTEMRGWLNTTLFSQLPYGLQTLIKQVNKDTTSGDTNGALMLTSTDKVFLPSYEEVGYTSTDVSANELALTSIYPKFTTANASRIVKRLNDSGAAVAWLTRSAKLSDATSFIGSNTSGQVAVVAGNATANYILFCFCI